MEWTIVEENQRTEATFLRVKENYIKQYGLQGDLSPTL
jgi:hypothetical protein